MAEQTYALAKSGVYGLSSGLYTDALDAIPDSGVSRWTFDTADTESGTALDSWGSNDGTINGAATGVSGANQTYTTNEAYSFSADDYVSQPAQVADGSALSVAVWVKFDDLPSSGRYSFFSARDSDGADIFYFGLDTQNSTGIRFGTYDGSAGHFADIDISNVSSGVWHHFVGTFSPSNGYTHYLDGSSAASNPDTTFDTVSRAPVLGAYDDEGTIAGYLSGDMDDPRVYSKELTSSEVSNLYNTGSISG